VVVIASVDISGVSALAHAHQLRWLLEVCRREDADGNKPAFEEIETLLDKAVILAADWDEKPPEVQNSIDASAYVPETAIGNRISSKGIGRLKRRPKRWLRLEAAWRCLHVADESLLTLAPDPMVRARGHEIYSQAMRWIGPHDARVVHVGRVLALRSHPSDQRDLSAEDRYAFVGLLHAVHQANDHGYARARSFRNIIMVAMVLLSLAAVGLVITGALFPNALPLCSAGGGLSGRPPACPTGSDAPTGGDVMLLAGIGAIAAGISAIAAISTVGSLVDPFSTPIYQGLLKIPVGAIAAILGVLAIEEGLEAGAGVPTTQGGIIFLAFVFGYSQQLLTRIVDNRGSQIRAGLSGRTADPSDKGVQTSTQ
jgi:hypothetical protein